MLQALVDDQVQLHVPVATQGLVRPVKAHTCRRGLEARWKLLEALVDADQVQACSHTTILTHTQGSAHALKPEDLSQQRTSLTRDEMNV